MIWHTVLIKQFSYQLKKKNNFHMEGVFDILSYVWYNVDISENMTLMEHGIFVHWKCDYVLWGLQKTVISHHQWQLYLTHLWHVGCWSVLVELDHPWGVLYHLLGCNTLLKFYMMLWHCDCVLQDLKHAVRQQKYYQHCIMWLWS